jgi:pimeloyl-ACP methyl ester carboxylesterase
MPFISINGLKTFYESKGKGKPLILIHGAGGSSGYWDIQLSELSKKLRVIAIDLPGHGKSECLKEKVTIERYSEHVAGMLKQGQLDEATVVGHSMGGLVVQQLVLKHPELVKKIVIVDSAAKFPGQSGLPDLIRSHPEVLGTQFLSYFFSPETISKGKLASMIPLLKSSGFNINVMADDFEAVAAVDLRERLREIAVPTLIIVGSDDFGLLSASRLLHEKIRSSKLEIIPRAGHMVMIEQPDEFNKALLMFVQS